MMLKDKRLRIMINSNAPWATSGYAVQASLLTERIRQENYPLALINFYGQEGGRLKINDIMMYPKIASPWGDDALVYHGKDFRADVSMTLQDIWTVDPNNIKRMTRFIPIVPIDHEPVPQGIVDRLRLAYRIVTYSEFGRKELEKQGFYSTCIPHGVDTDVFKPMAHKEALRKELKINPDIFLFGMIGANKDNPPRKSFQEAIDAFAMFHEKHPNSGMFFHTLLQQTGGFPIQAYWKVKGLPDDKFYFLQPYDTMFRVGRFELAKIINCFDCLLMPSTNEGFGVPAIEAQSCGVPVITNNFTAMRELIDPGKTGYHCDILYKRYTPLMSYVAVPDPTSIFNRMLDVYKADRVAMGKAAREWVMERYDMNMIYKTKWSPFFAQLEKEIYESKTEKKVIDKPNVDMPADVTAGGGAQPMVTAKT